MKAVDVIDGSCGFRTHIVASMDSDAIVTLTISSECDAVNKWGHEIKRVNWQECLGRSPLTSRLWQSAMRTLHHRSCPVLPAVLRAIETEIGAARPAEIQICFSSSEISNPDKWLGTGLEKIKSPKPMDEPGKMLQVRFLPAGIQGSIFYGKVVDDAARHLGVDLHSICGGNGKCGKCRVRLLNPEGFGRSAYPLSPPTQQEIDLFSDKELREGWRLACQSRVLTDAAFYIPKESMSSRQLIRKAPGLVCVAPKPAVKLWTAKVPLTNLQKTSSAWEQLVGQIVLDPGEASFYPDIKLLKTISETLNGGQEIDMALRNDGECIGIMAHANCTLTGIALDIGTTTLAVYLCNLDNGEVLATASAVNPQISFGEDVMSRIAYAAEITSRKKLQELVVETVNRMIVSACAQAGICIDSVVDMTCVANTCMHHLFLGLDPSGLGRSPFTPVVTRSLDIKARDVGIHIAPGAWIHMLPAVSAFIGADTVGVMLAVDVSPSEETVLIIDVGTNGEIVLAARNRFICASCATGPALEGAALSCGMRAAAGAVERVWIEPETLSVRYKVIGSDKKNPIPAAGICGSGVIDAISQMFAAGIIKKNGNIDRQSNCQWVKCSGNDIAFVIVPATESAGSRDIVISQNDIRAVQVAKGAIQAAARLLMAEAGIRFVDRIILAGAFGSLIDPVSALTIGLIPEIAQEKILAVGNAAGDGARLALLNETIRGRADVLAERMETIELTMLPKFPREFAMAMHFPHMFRG